MAEKRTWQDLTPTQQRLVVAGGLLEAATTCWMLVDLRRRSPALVRGPRWAWALSSVVQPFGPLAYALLGRRALPQALRVARR
ncbi:PLDc N-terminal domain-containing protein [Amnibacterium sp. CER49]|uniref:PLDc N-terminal domain-containing protein n=1 Tax=Amnibacterium sp. CER49 TaxID=3039161 RepID=UPI00244C3782|nr:PLDc N-terminal domain-containing protein [Amnibacterium sp. CER49]MDH2442915.1 PLDc N-terminal domain-containing protein [Amnibacterium sp. CER49]